MVLQNDLLLQKYIKLINSVITTTTVAAINLPNTIFVILSGDVNSNCSVPDFSLLKMTSLLVMVL